jgi:hypothetical protein
MANHKRPAMPVSNKKTATAAPNARRWTRWCPLLLATAPFAVACIAGSPAEPAPLGKLREFPPIAFAQYSVNFGEVPPLPVIDVHFDFVNRSDSTVEILELRPSCNCLSPTLLGGQKMYGPNQAGRFYAQVETASEPAGPQDYLVEMDYADATGRTYTEALIFRVTLPDLKVTVNPPEVLFYQLAGEAGSQTIHITDHRDRPLQVTEVVCESPLASFVIGETVVDEHGRSTTPVQINIPEGIPPMREITWVSIRTTDEEFSELRVPMLIQGPLESQEIVPASSAVPAPLQLDVEETPDDDAGSEQP